MLESFENLKPIGDKGEQQAIDFIKKVLKQDILSSNNNYKYDVLTTNNIKYEVKKDLKAQYTKNLFVEYGTGYDKNIKMTLPPINNIKASGISNTESNYYIFVFDNIYNLDLVESFILIDTSKLKSFIKENEPRSTTHRNNFYNTTSYGYLIPIEQIKSISTNYIKYNEIYINV